MVKRSAKSAGYQLWLEAEVHAMRDELPGNIRQRVKRTLTQLAKQPRPASSQPLVITDMDVPPEVEIRRLRLEHWRIIYAVYELEKWVWVLAIRQRPPYAYEDLPEIVAKLEE